jgi:hypothetical protein
MGPDWRLFAPAGVFFHFKIVMITVIWRHPCTAFGFGLAGILRCRGKTKCNAMSFLGDKMRSQNQDKSSI